VWLFKGTRVPAKALFENLEDQLDVRLEIRINPGLHDREIKLSNGWSIKIGRGFDIYQRPDDRLHIGSNDLDLRPCLETSVDFVRMKS
jgi:ATP-dependent Lon protease